MFGFSKKQGAYRTDVIENIIGVGLPNRNKFMNYGDVADENIYSGYAIGCVFSEDQDRLSFEFDAVYLHYLVSVLAKVGYFGDGSLCFGRRWPQRSSLTWARRRRNCLGWSGRSLRRSFRWICRLRC
jgi:hypothetical protein